MIDQKIFKAYDIRGVYPDQLDEEGIYKIGRAVVEFLKPKEVIIGYDARNSTPKLVPHLISGINDGGAKVIDVGMVATEMLYFAAGHLNTDAGIMLTASHDPSKYTGMKFVRNGTVPIGVNSGLLEIKNLATSQAYAPKLAPQNVDHINIGPEYKKAINKLVPLNKLPNFKVVVDAGNGVGGILFNTVFGDTNLRIVPMYFDPDGNFPNHPPNPLIKINTADLRKKVIEEGADLGIALDGDGDRIFFIDSKGNFSSGYLVTALLASIMLEKHPRAKIVHENRLVWAIEDEIKKSKGVAVVSRPGHSFIKAKMRASKAVFAGETSSHFYYKDTYYTESSMLTTALVLHLMAKTHKSYEQLLAPYREKYKTSGEINFATENPDKTISRVASYYSDPHYKIDRLDGITIQNDRIWRMNLRKSNTEPSLIRLNVEGKTENIINNCIQEIKQIIETT